jgi:hypothetical protein
MCAGRDEIEDGKTRVSIAVHRILATWEVDVRRKPWLACHRKQIVVTLAVADLGNHFGQRFGLNFTTTSLHFHIVYPSYPALKIRMVLSNL